MLEKFSLTIKTKSNPPISGFLFRKIKNKILGKKYTLSVVFLEKTEIKKINKTYRKKDCPTDILSFQIEKENGEIFICVDICKEKSKDFNRDLKNYIYFLFIHGLLHLKGFDHSSKMESEEQRYRKSFGI